MRCPQCHKLVAIIGIKISIESHHKTSVIHEYKCGDCNWEFEEEGWVENNPSHRYSSIWEREEE